MKELSESYIGWDTEEHLSEFNFWNNLSNYEFNFRWGSFIENQVLIERLKRGDTLLEVGCATGTTVRWLKNNNKIKNIEYLGIDLSDTAIKKARSLHQNIDFRKVDLGPLKEYYNSFDYVFSRDTLMHQEKPFEFLEELINCATKSIILRIRTRDNGVTDFNYKNSCQLHYDNFWMPYIVINIDELINFFKKFKIIKNIEINRSYEVLGGNVKRYLPKDLYFKGAGGAETTLVINLNRSKKQNDFNVIYNENLEGRALINKKRNKRIKIKILKFLRLLK